MSPPRNNPITNQEILAPNRIQSFHHFYKKDLMDIKNVLNVQNFQIKHKTNIIILQIIHVMIMKIQ